MSDNLIAYIILSISFMVVFGMGDFLLLRLRWKAEHSRKFVHIGSGLLACTFPFYFDSHWWVMAICASFVGLLYLSLKFNFLKGINQVDRKTYGSLVYPLAVYGSFYFYSSFAALSPMIFLIPILLLSIPDPAAALVGKNYPIRRFSADPHAKSWGGSGAFFLSAAVIVFIPMYASYDYGVFRSISVAVMIALVTTAIEAFSKKGLDNLFVPLGACICLYFLMP